MLDVICIGAGPAGASAARLLAAWGHRVRLVHRASGPVLAPAESLPPSSRKLFSAIGALEAIEAAAFYRSTGNTVWWEDDEPRCELFREGERGYQVERGAFDALLRDLAVAAGASIVDGAAREARVDDEGTTVVLAGGTELRARFVLDCSGRSGALARRLGLRRPLADHPRTVALVAIWRREDGWTGVDPTHTLVESYADGWAWSIPVAPGIRYVTAMVDPQRTELARGRPAVDVYLAELHKTRHLASMLESAALVRGPWGCDASMYVAARYTEGSALLVGDAGSFIDPLSSFGVKKALASAWLAAVAVHTALRTPSSREAAFEFFSARETEIAASLVVAARGYFDAAAGRHPSAFWTDRSAAVDLPAVSEPDVRVLREDVRVRQAFETLKGADAVRFERAPGLRVAPHPVVRGREIVLEERLVTAALPGGARFLRDVDVAGLLALAPGHAHVPDLFDAYNRRHPPVALPDFLGALSVMVAFGMLAATPLPASRG